MSAKPEAIRSLATDRIWIAQAARNLANKDLAQDAVQDVALIALRSLPDDHPEPRKWIGLVLKRQCWQLNRREGSEASLLYETMASSGDGHVNVIESEPAGRCDDPEHVAQAREQLHEIGEAMELLKHDEAQALFEQMEGYGYRDICDMHGWTFRKVDRCLTEGRARLRELVAA